MKTISVSSFAYGDSLLVLDRGIRFRKERVNGHTYLSSVECAAGGIGKNLADALRDLSFNILHVGDELPFGSDVEAVRVDLFE